MIVFRAAIEKEPSTVLECHGIIVFVYLHTLYTFATWPGKGICESNDLFFVDSSRPDLDYIAPWLHCIRHSCELVYGFWDSVGNGPLATLALS